MALHTPIKQTHTREPWTPDGSTRSTVTGHKWDATPDSATLYRQTQQLFASPVDRRTTTTPKRKTQSKLSFRRVDSGREVVDEFPIDKELMDSLEASMSTEVLAKFDPAAAKPKSAPDTADTTKVQILPIRMKSWTPHSAAPRDTPIDTLMRTIANYQSFILAGPDVPRNMPMPSNPMASWIYDSGTMVTQISPQVAQRMWQALKPIQRTSLLCVTAFESRVQQMQLCQLQNLRLNDPETGNLSRKRNTLIFVNTSLSAHECILGVNTMMDFQLTMDTAAGRVYTPDGMGFTLLTERQAHLWKTHGRKRMVRPPDPKPPDLDTRHAIYHHQRVRLRRRQRRIRTHQLHSRI